MTAARPAETQTPATSRAGRSSEELLLDAHTLRDLGIFAAESGQASLFDFCNLTLTEGGARVLQRRMERPWSSAPRIHATQEAITFILEQRQAFTRLASAYTTARVERYAQSTVGIVHEESLPGFVLSVLGLWMDHDRNYFNIVNGVRFTCELIRVLRQFIAALETTSPAGEIGPLLDEMRALLASARLSRVPGSGSGGGVWQTVALDQVFRLHEREAIARLVELVHEIDALAAMAEVTARHDFVLPRIEAGPLRVQADGLVHPFVTDAVANPVALDQNRRVLFLTGPNMAGKTTYLRAFATAVYLAHLGMGVPARSFGFVPTQRLFSSISLNDDIHTGVSYFRAEALRVKAIAEAIVEGCRVVTAQTRTSLTPVETTPSF
ncbi:MAG: hypothetical protein JJU22_08180, partial [Gammaproteobacteria bacterium]|nr:hypothetical protein [Gammaproteobacteria bacterium]